MAQVDRTIPEPQPPEPAATVETTRSSPDRGFTPSGETPPPSGLVRRRILKEDGRYLIYYEKSGEPKHV